MFRLVIISALLWTGFVWASSSTVPDKKTQVQKVRDPVRETQDLFRLIKK